MKTKLLFLAFVIIAICGCCQKEVITPDPIDNNPQKVVAGPIVENYGADFFVIDTLGDTLWLVCPCDTFDYENFPCAGFDGNNPQDLMYNIYASLSYRIQYEGWGWIDVVSMHLYESFTDMPFHKTVASYINNQNPGCGWDNECYDIPLYAVCTVDGSTVIRIPEFCE